MPLHLEGNSMNRIGKFFGIHLRIRKFYTINQYYHFSNCASTDFIIGFIQFNFGFIEKKTFPSDISHFRYIVAVERIKEKFNSLEEQFKKTYNEIE